MPPNRPAARPAPIQPPPSTGRRGLLGRGLAAALADRLGATTGVAGLAALAACSTPGTGPATDTAVPLDTTHPAQGQDSRVLFVVLHYTGENLADSLAILTQQAVSAHYLIGDQPTPVVYALVPEARRAWHAGDSAWAGHSQLNASSIGIEIVNPGPVTRADGRRVFAPFAPAQIELLIALLRGIVARHGIRPDRILGHSDVAPQRKLDPGPAFPWPRLAQAGLMRWPDAAAVAALKTRWATALPDAAWWQPSLAQLGHAVPRTGVLDGPTRQVIAAFQMKYRPQRFDGEPDAETAALLQALNTAPAPAP